jgi:hypothetical protein
LKHAEPPRVEDCVPIFQQLFIRCMEEGLPIGLAPNIHVSLVILPEECRWLVQDERILERFRHAERMMVVKRAAFAALLAGRRAVFGPHPRPLAGATRA